MLFLDFSPYAGWNKQDGERRILCDIYFFMEPERAKLIKQRVDRMVVVNGWEIGKMSVKWYKLPLTKWISPGI